jgi:glycosyltransferase involved in cell wall biosynthesis/predicted O-methyltransferase YrrM
MISQNTSQVSAALPLGDYVSPGLAIILPDAAFPEMIVGDASLPRWPYLRRWVEHNWYTDRRNPEVGFASRDEAAILYNSALKFQDKPCLEVGCWRGWSAVHLASGAGSLDIIDPVLADATFADSVRASCERAGVLDHVTFHSGFSPNAIDALALSTGKRWSLIFIDGDHEGDAPRLDAEAAMRCAADTAMVLFHDLASPYVAAGLNAMREAGWNTMLYQTMQIMGVAWRGDVEPPPHVPDPRVFWTLPKHLAAYQVSGWVRPNVRETTPWWPGMTMADRRNAAAIRAQTAEDDLLVMRVDAARRQIVVEAERVPSPPPSARAPEFLAMLELARWAMQKTILIRMLRRSSKKRAAKVRAKAESMTVATEFSGWLVDRMSKRRRMWVLLWRSALLGRAHVSLELFQEWAKEGKLPRKPVRPAGQTKGSRSLKEFSLKNWNGSRPTLCHSNLKRMDPTRQNVIVVVHETSRTGAPILGWNIAHHLARRYNVFTVHLGDGPLTPEFEAISIEVHKQKPDMDAGPRSLFEGRQFKYAIVNSSESRPMVEVCERHSVPTVLLMHEFASYVYPLASLTKAFDCASEIVFSAPMVARVSQEAHPGLHDRHLHILPQGRCVIPANRTDKGCPPKLLGQLTHARWVEGAFVVIGAGSVCFRKGVDLFLATAAAVQRNQPSRVVYFVWIGKGYRPDEDIGYSVYLKEQVERSGLQARVIFLDEVTDLDPIYALADAFLLSSRLDPLPNVTIDAASCGIPIVCFKSASGIADLLLADPETAEGVVDYADVEKAAQVICRLATDEAVRNQIAKATDRLARGTFDMQRYVAQLDAIGTSAAKKAEDLSLAAR